MSSSNRRISPDSSKLYTNRDLRTPTGSSLPHVLLFAAQILLLVSPPFKGRRIVAICTIPSLLILTQLDPYFSIDIGLSQPASIGWVFALSTLEKFALQGPVGPEGSFWRVDRSQGEAMNYPPFSFKKLQWALVLTTNLRGIRWNFQVKNVPPLPKEKKSSFLISQMLNLVYYIVMADLFANLTIHWFYTGANGNIGDVDNTHLTLQHDSWRWSFGKAFVFGATPYYMLSAQYTLGAILAVSIGISRPEDWPAHFGKLTEVTTVRDFWGKYWHQTLRRVWNVWAGAFVDLLGIKRGTTLSSYTQLWFAFCISGLMHANGMRTIPSPANLFLADYTVGWIQFFVWQAAAITFEDFAQWCWRHLTSDNGNGVNSKLRSRKILRTAIGYAWVTANIWYSLPWVGDLMLRMRIGDESFLPFSIWEGFVRQLPTPP